jgi:hypothetical protein
MTRYIDDVKKQYGISSGETTSLRLDTNAVPKAAPAKVAPAPAKPAPAAPPVIPPLRIS